jgi:quinol-cytochrome oxidoreductase complex cytochrome b subunit
MNRRNFIDHLHPPRVTLRALRAGTTFGLGVVTLTLLALLSASGFLLMVYYVPTTQGALKSTEDIQHAVVFGAFIRSMHRFAAHGMVLTAFLHLLRVSFTGAYVRRWLNWVVGLGLFVLTLGLAFTGYLLPWDQLSYWAVRVSTNLADHIPVLGTGIKHLLLGGTEVGQAALTRFYMLHVALLPALIFILIAYHLWRIRRDGGLACNPGTKDATATIPAWPHLVYREAILAIVVIIAFTLISSFAIAPLGGPPDLHAPTNPEKTPWYFLWLQEMVSYSALLGGFVFPALLLVLLLALPLIDKGDDTTGTWFGPVRARVTLMIVFGVAVLGFLTVEWFFLSGALGDTIGARPSWRMDLFNPAAAMALLAVLAATLTIRLTYSRRTAALAGLIVMLVAVVGFAVVAWCRGPNWVFYWPWEEWPHVS